jgi:hypothetical protein
MADKTYTVRLVFAELAFGAGTGDRVFHVSLTGRRVLENFDIVKAAGGPMHTVVREFKGIKPDPKTLAVVVEFEPVRDVPLLGGIEIVEESTGLTPEGLSGSRGIAPLHEYRCLPFSPEIRCMNDSRNNRVIRVKPGYAREVTIALSK